MSQAGLRSAPNGGFWWSGGDVGLDVDLPVDVQLKLRSQDVQVYISLSAPGLDREIAPELQLDFGRSKKPALTWHLPAEVVSSGIRCTLPRGVKRVRLLPNRRPFWAMNVAIRVERILRRVPQGEVRIFGAVRGVDGGIWDLSARLIETDAILLRADDMALDENGAFQSRSSDPRMIFKLRQALKPGWYQVDLKGLSDAVTKPRMYIEAETGFLEHESIEFAHRDFGRLSGYFWLDREIELLRFDIADEAGVGGAIFDLTIRPLLLPPVAQLFRPSVLRAIRSRRLTRQTLSRLFNPAAETGAWALPLLNCEEIPEPGDTGIEYEAWRDAFDFDADKDAASCIEALKRAELRPRISILMPAWRTPLELLDEAIESVRAQLYEDWELVIANDSPEDDALIERLDEWASLDSRIIVVHRPKNGGISEATNSAFDESTGDWIALLDHDDLLSSNALAEVVLAINDNPKAELIYSDEDKIDMEGHRYGPYFKPDFSYHLLLGQNYFNHLTVHRAENIEAVGGWRSEFDGSQDYDLNLRIIAHVERKNIVHIPKVLYHWRAVPGSTAVSGDEKSYAQDAGARALVAHLGDIDQPGAVRLAPGTPWYWVDFAIPDPAPKVSLIIPTRDGADFLRLSVGTILEKTEYPNYEIIIVDNQSSDPETFELFRRYGQDERVRVVLYDDVFNFSAINNFAIEQSDGEIVGLINNDVEVLDPLWLREMVSHAVRPDIGCVGAKLLYPDDTIQHGGVIIGIGGVAGHSHKYAPRDSTGYFGRLALTHELSAVTAACLLLRRAVFDEVGGLSEERLPVAFNDVDLCLKVQEAGYLNLFTPHAVLYHHESVSRGTEDSPEKKQRFQREVEYMLQRWRTDELADPYYSPNLSLTHEDFRLKAAEDVEREGARTKT